MADVTSWTDPAEEPSDTPATGRRVRSFVSPGLVEVDARILRGDVNLAAGPIDRAQVTLTPRSPASASVPPCRPCSPPARRRPSRNEWRPGSRTWWPSARARPPCSTWR